ncbi:MAG TPA: FAD-dependent oxidoreductase, partial [Thermoanaerobaculia bacterium]|nr:FAD-dependent oxidoreductase [Thermoanaerobaculia bacterium]
MSDLKVVVAGAGVIGLSLAYELTHSPGVRVVLVDRDEPGQASSWAGAGIVTPAAPTAPRPIDRLRELSGRTLAAWSERLKAETGIDNEYIRCGGLELALEEEDLPGLERAAEDWREQGVAIEAVAAGRLRELEPALAPGVAGAYLLPDEAQIRNPRHVAALVAACAGRGVEVRTGTPVRGLAMKGDKDGGRVTGLVTDGGTIEGDAVVVAAGAWSAALLETVGVSLPVRPVRGQIALLAPPAPLLSRVIWIGARYLVPRRDGRILVGSTEEEAGFTAHPTAEGVRGLLDL